MKNGYVLGVIISLIFSIVIFKGCHPSPVDKPIQISQGKEIPISPEIKKIIPDADFAVSHTPIKPPVGKKVEEVIVVTKEKRVDIIPTLKNDYGWYRGLGVCANLNLQDVDLGLIINGPWYWRLQSGGMIGIRNSGVTAGFRITENSQVGVNYCFNYKSLTPNPGIYLSLGF